MTHPTSAGKTGWHVTGVGQIEDAPFGDRQRCRRAGRAGRLGQGVCAQDLLDCADDARRTRLDADAMRLVQGVHCLGAGSECRTERDEGIGMHHPARRAGQRLHALAQCFDSVGAAHLPEHTVVDLVDAHFGQVDKQVRADDGTYLRWMPDDETVILSRRVTGGAIDVVLARGVREWSR